jgi:hypothetical protein
MSTTSSPSKVTRQARIGKIIAGIQKYFGNLPAIVLAGTSYTPAALVALLQKALDAITLSSNSKAKWIQDVQVERNQLAAISQVLRLIKAFVIAAIGDSNDSAQKLEEFGFTPRKARPTKVAVKAEAAVKVRATRVARGTKGSRQKAMIHGVPAQPSGNGTATAETPAPAASPAPAPIKPAS